MDIYKLYRNFWDYAFSNPDKIKPNDVAIFSFAIEHCNRLGWKQKFGFPTSMAMEATGIKSYSVFKKHLDNLINIGFIIIVERSKNQYSSNIIALQENYKALDKAPDKALDKALIKHATKQLQSTRQSTRQSKCSIYKQRTKNNKQEETIIFDDNFKPVLEKWLDYKKERRETYKSEKSLNSCYKNLFELSGGDPIIADKIIEQSMANNWAGLFALKNNNNNKTQTDQPFPYKPIKHDRIITDSER